MSKTKREASAKDKAESFDEQHRAYLGLRHFFPETARQIRCALDVGISPKKLQKMASAEVPDEYASMVASAIVYMARDTIAGAVYWNGTRYNWQELREGSRAEAPAPIVDSSGQGWLFQ